MGLEIATGRAKCANCENHIPSGDLCMHVDVNSRAAPFFCSSCIARWHRILNMQTRPILYEVVSVDGEFCARKSGEDTWLCEVKIEGRMRPGVLPIVAAQIAQAEGLQADRCLFLGSRSIRIDGEWKIAELFEFEVDNENEGD